MNHYDLVIAEQDIDVVYGRAQLVDAHTVEVNGPEGVTHLRGEKILIALGSHPTIPPIEGLATTPHLTSDLLTSQEDMELQELPSSLIIVGDGRGQRRRGHSRGGDGDALSCNN